jgi:solute:Na+ symporter, SSS family
MLLTLFFFGLYIAIAVIIGIVSSRKETEEGFMLADRKVRGVQLAATFSATFFDGSVLSIYLAYVYQYGISALSIFIGLFLGFLLLRKYASKIKEKADQLGVYSMPEYFYKTLGKRNGLMFTLFIVVEILALLIVNLIISGKILSTIFPIPYWASVLIGGGIVLSYLLLAGFKAVVKTDFFQLTIMVAMSLGVATLLFGGISIGSLHLDLSPAALGNSIGFLILTGLGILVTPDTWQRIFASSDQKSLKQGLGYAGFILLFLGVCISVLGLAVRYAFPGILPEDALITGFTQLLPFGIKQLGIVLLYAVALSSSDTEIFVLSSVVTRDLKNYTKRFSEESMRRMTRWIMIGLVALVSLVAIFYQNILSLGFTLASLNLVLFPVVFGSLYWKLKEKAVFWSLALALASVLVLFAFGQLNPQNAVLPLPIALVSLIVLQKLSKPEVS